MYKAIIDTGKPSEETFKSKEEVFKRFLELKDLAEKEELPYCDIIIYKVKYKKSKSYFRAGLFNKTEKNITDTIFKEFEKDRKLKDGVRK